MTNWFLSTPDLSFLVFSVQFWFLIKLVSYEKKHVLIISNNSYYVVYFNCSKKVARERYQENRDMQNEIERLMQVEEKTHLVCLGHMNGRLSTLEPNIKTDQNGLMLESWVNDLGMVHLNKSELCEGVYTCIHTYIHRTQMIHYVVI